MNSVIWVWMSQPVRLSVSTVLGLSTLRKTRRVNSTKDNRCLLSLRTGEVERRYIKTEKKSNKFKFRVDLTKRRLLLLKKARDMTKNMPNVDFTFSDVNCRLALRLTNGGFKFFNSETELASIIANW